MATKVECDKNFNNISVAPQGDLQGRSVEPDSRPWISSKAVTQLKNCFIAVAGIVAIVAATLLLSYARIPREVLFTGMQRLGLSCAISGLLIGGIFAVALGFDNLSRGK